MKLLLQYTFALTIMALLWTSCTSSIDGTESSNANNSLQPTPTPTPITYGTVLIPGSGFINPTVEPPATGPGPKAIARFDVVPHQPFANKFNVGVVAFHKDGIARIEFSVDNGPWVAVTQMALNNQVDVYEYFVTLDANLFSSAKPTEVRAIAFPNSGETRVLTLPLYANKGNSLPEIKRYVAASGGSNSTATCGITGATPCDSIERAAKSIELDPQSGGKADNATIYLLAGNHAWNTSAFATSPQVRVDNVWVTIRPAPGLHKGDVRIVSRDVSGLLIPRVHVKDIVFRSSVAGRDGEFWADQSDFVGNGQWTQISSTGWINIYSQRYVTNSFMSDDIGGLGGATLSRNVHLERIGATGWAVPGMVINCSVDDMDVGPTDWHGNVIQWNFTHSEHDNAIVYGLKATNIGAGIQGIFVKTVTYVKNVALVNILIDSKPGYYGPNPISDVLHHVLFWNLTLDSLLFDSTDLVDISVKGSVFSQINSTAAQYLQDEWFDNNHYITDPNHYGTLELGTNYTTGDPKFVDQANNDYRPRSDSPLKYRMMPPVPVDLDLSPRSLTQSSVGAYE